MDGMNATWRKSSYSGPRLAFGLHAWATFAATLKAAAPGV